jgi:hypothetical protein
VRSRRDLRGVVGSGVRRDRAAAIAARATGAVLRAHLFVFDASSSKRHGGGLGIGAGPCAHVMGPWRRTSCVRRPVQPAVAAAERHTGPVAGEHVPRRRALTRATPRGRGTLERDLGVHR